MIPIERRMEIEAEVRRIEQRAKERKQRRNMLVKAHGTRFVTTEDLRPGMITIHPDNTRTITRAVWTGCGYSVTYQIYEGPELTCWYDEHQEFEVLFSNPEIFEPETESVEAVMRAVQKLVLSI
jgi:hypothetical protein